jgi:bifunctional DNA-binding transcriptional regulator/antitoxin component of YhaV-PrlF toxin-antitoxin module
VGSYIVKLDRRGRLTLPAKLKRRLKIGSLVRLEERVEGVVIVPIRDPLEELKGSAKARVSEEELDELAESMVSREALK